MSTTERVAAGGSCSLNCNNDNDNLTMVPSYEGSVECGVDGEWSISKLPLRCIVKDQICSIADLVTAAQAIPNFGSVDQSCPGGEKKDNDNVYGGVSCPFNCTSPWYPTGPLVCSNGSWIGSAECGGQFFVFSLGLPHTKVFQIKLGLPSVPPSVCSFTQLTY